MTNDLHVYLDRDPEREEVHPFLETLGFTKVKTNQGSPEEPGFTLWTWKHDPLSSRSGIELYCFNYLHRDNLYCGKYATYYIFQGAADTTQHEVSIVDITAKLLLDKYGGVLHNLQRTDRKYPNVFLSGLNNR